MRNDAVTGSPRFSFVLPSGVTVVGPVQGNGGMVDAARIVAAARMAASKRPHGLYEPAPGCVAVFPEYCAAGNGEPVIAPLAGLVPPSLPKKTKAPRLTRAQSASVRSLIDDSGYTRAEAEAWVRAFEPGDVDAILDVCIGSELAEVSR